MKNIYNQSATESNEEGTTSLPTPGEFTHV